MTLYYDFRKTDGVWQRRAGRGPWKWLHVHNEVVPTHLRGEVQSERIKRIWTWEDDRP